MASAPQQKFEAGIARACELRDAERTTVDYVNECWAALRTGVVAARKLEEVLDSCSEEQMRAAVDFILQRGAQKKAARGQVKECLRILVSRLPWLTFVRADHGLREQVSEALDSDQDAELIKQIVVDEVTEAGADEDQALQSTAEEVPPQREVAAEEEEPAPCTKPLTISERLAKGKAVLESFGWNFPVDPTGTSGDEATSGFQLIFEAVTALTTTSGRASVGDEPLAVLAELEQDWSNLLQFLLSMYTSGVRKTYSSRIRFVATTLRALVPAFRELAPWASLPWGHLPMPAEEAEAEARVLEEFQRLQAEEAENLALARALQAQEDADALALEQAHLQLAQEDFALAWKLQEEAKGPVARSRTVQLPRLQRRRSAGGA